MRPEPEAADRWPVVKRREAMSASGGGLGGQEPVDLVVGGLAEVGVEGTDGGESRWVVRADHGVGVVAQHPGRLGCADRCGEDQWRARRPVAEVEEAQVRGDTGGQYPAGMLTIVEGVHDRSPARYRSNQAAACRTTSCRVPASLSRCRAGLIS